MSAGSILKVARKAKGLTLRQLEGKSGVSNAYLSQLENGRIARPSAVTLYKLSGILGIPFDDLIVEAGFVDPINEDGYVPKMLIAMNITRSEEREMIAFLTHIRTFQP